jgi:hypothetical protein
MLSLIYSPIDLNSDQARDSSGLLYINFGRFSAEGIMKKAYGKVLPAVLLASTFAVGACASSSEVDDLKASVNTLQRDVAGLKSDTAAARAESAKAAQEARSAAAAAQQAAAEAKAAANAATAASDKSDRMFQKSLRK